MSSQQLGWQAIKLSAIKLASYEAGKAGKPTNSESWKGETISYQAGKLASLQAGKPASLQIVNSEL